MDCLCVDPTQELLTICREAHVFDSYSSVVLDDPEKYFCGETFELECLATWKQDRHLALVFCVPLMCCSGHKEDQRLKLLDFRNVLIQIRKKFTTGILFLGVFIDNTPRKLSVDLEDYCDCVFLEEHELRYAIKRTVVTDSPNSHV
jgi:hypothetical protein